jgi:23S rRNA (uracil1939-C5)-methyltransferase
MGTYTPPCPHFPNCFGCSLIDRPYPVQLQSKRDRLVKALAAYPDLARLEVPAVVGSPRRLGYRGRVKLAVSRSKKEIVTGLYFPQSHRVVDISSCPVHPKPVNQAIQELKRQMPRLGIEPYNESDDSGQLRYLDFRYSFSRRELGVTLVTRHPAFPQGPELSRALRRRFAFINGVIQNINEERGNVIWGKEFRSLAGRDSILEQIGFLKLRFPAGVFSQANPPVARRLYEAVVQLAGLTGEERVLDLYCGVGPLSLYLATAAATVWGIDEYSLSISTAKQNARMNGFHNCRFFVGDAAEKIAELKDNLSGIDLLVCNPPRKGIQSQALQAVLAADAPRIIYVSCEPVTLARDLDRFSRDGYRTTTIQPFDMFPQTEEVETVVLLEKF